MKHIQFVTLVTMMVLTIIAAKKDLKGVRTTRKLKKSAKKSGKKSGKKFGENSSSEPSQFRLEEHFGVGFNTKYMSNKPSSDLVINHIIPDLKNKLGITKFRIYNAIVDAEYVSELIYGNRETKFIVDIGFIWWNDTEKIGINELTQDDVNRYLTRYIDTVGESVKVRNGDDYEWLDNVDTIGYINEPYIEWKKHWTKTWETVADVGNGMIKINRMTQNFFNTYKDGKYKTKITIAPIFIGSPMSNMTDIMVEESIKLQAEAGAPIALAACVGLPQSYDLGMGQGEQVHNTLEYKVIVWNNLFQELDIPVDPSEIKLVITETGWPTDGFEFGSEYYAGEYYLNTIEFMNKTDSVLHNVDVYFFEALDEDLKPGHSVEPHWGLMHSNGTIKDSILTRWPWKPENADNLDVLVESDLTATNELLEELDESLLELEEKLEMKLSNIEN